MLVKDIDVANVLYGLFQQTLIWEHVTFTISNYA